MTITLFVLAKAEDRLKVKHKILMMTKNLKANWKTIWRHVFWCLKLSY